jgi:hypothetical protein
VSPDYRSRVSSRYRSRVLEVSTGSRSHSGKHLPDSHTGREVSLVINLSSLVRERAEIRAYSELQAVMKEA